MSNRRKKQVSIVTAKEIEKQYGYTVEEQLKDSEEAERFAQEMEATRDMWDDPSYY